MCLTKLTAQSAQVQFSVCTEQRRCDLQSFASVQRFVTSCESHSQAGSTNGNVAYSREIKPLPFAGEWTRVWVTSIVVHSPAGGSGYNHRRQASFPEAEQKTCGAVRHQPVALETEGLYGI